MDLTYSLKKPKEYSAMTNYFHAENLLATLGSSLENNVIDLIAGSGERVSFDKNLLVIFSRSIRKCLADLPCCEIPTSITLVDIKFRALKNVKELLENSLRDVETELSHEDIEDFFEAAEALGIQMSTLWKSLVRCNADQSRRAIKEQVIMKKNETERETETVKTGANKKEEGDLFDETPLEISLDEENIENNDVTDKSLPYEDPDYKDEDDSVQGESSESEESQEEISIDTEHNSPVSQDQQCHAGLSERSEATTSVSPESAQASSEVESKLSCVLCKKPMKGPSFLREHYSTSHFFKDLFKKYVASSRSQTMCSIEGCNKNYRDKNCLVRHIGATHNKILDILKRNGIQIPSGVAGNNKKRRAENSVEVRSVKIKTEQSKAVDNNNKSLTKIKCDLCEKDFSTKHNMERHKKKSHIV